MFSSLGRCVTIGTLGREVADASLKKQKVGVSINTEWTDKNISCNERPEDDLPDDISIGLGLVVFSLPANETYCAEYNYNIKTKFNNISRKDISYISPAIFL